MSSTPPSFLTLSRYGFLSNSRVSLIKLPQQSVMRLIDTQTGSFLLVNDPREVRYAILSHVWDSEGEQSYQDLIRIQTRVRDTTRAPGSGRGFRKRKRVAPTATHPNLAPSAVLSESSPKIRDACAFAFADGYHYIWIDSCCIDKTSSAELSEAINSMYLWYSLSAVCYAFLHDVDGTKDPHPAGSDFRASKWFERGWTLQELIAPRNVIFVSSQWTEIGAKATFSQLIQEITAIDEEVLVHARPLSTVSVARRMSWAANRSTTRKEDEAYCLMGIFGVHIPIVYGEGCQAFFRLQEEIIKHVSDQSIFVWDRTFSFRRLNRPQLKIDNGTTIRFDTLLSASPRPFASSKDIRAISAPALGRRIGVTPPPPAYIVTSSGVRASFPLISLGPRVLLAVLGCVGKDGYLIALVLKRPRNHFVYSVGLTVFHDGTHPIPWNLDIITVHDSHTLYAICLPPDFITELSVSVADCLTRADYATFVAQDVETMLVSKFTGFF
ncbi:hypothetical protein C8Q76DRAFT_860252 [Earliella scabrosa]|nr:hypothetical protein C8Q76DRAFT_860252 [Earliella scabrosa]